MLTEVHVTDTADKDEEIPPPLPQRTPESYILAADAGWSSVWSQPGILAEPLSSVFTVDFTAFVIIKSNNVLCYIICAACERTLDSQMTPAKD